MKIIRATGDLPAGTELVFPYVPPGPQDHDYEKSQKGLKSWGFECSCPFYTDAKNTDKKTKDKRKGLNADLVVAFGTKDDALVDADLRKIERILAQLDKTTTKGNPKCQEPNFGILALAVTGAHAMEGNFGIVIGGALKTLDVLDFVVQVGKSSVVVEKRGLVVDYVVQCWMLLWTSYAAIGELRKAGIAKELPVTSYRIAVGEDETFEETYGTKARSFIMQGEVWGGL